MDADAREPESVGYRPFSFEEAGHITDEQSSSLRTMMETLARNLTHAFSVWLRTGVTVTAGAQQQKPFRDFAGAVENCLLVPLHLPEQHALALLSWPLPLASHIVELLLGGTGTQGAGLRELTEIEEEIFSSVLDLLFREWNTVWADLGLRFTRSAASGGDADRQILPPEQKTFCSTLEIAVGGSRGEVGLCMTTPVLASALRQMSAARRAARRENEVDKARLLELLRDARVRVGLCFEPVHLTGYRLADLRVGATMHLPLPANAPAELRISEVPVARANPVRLGDHRAARAGVPVRTAGSTAAPTGETLLQIEQGARA